MLLQLRLRPLPQLLRYLPVLRLRARTALLRNWHIIRPLLYRPHSLLPRPSLALHWCNTRPRLVVRADRRLRRNQLPERHEEEAEPRVHVGERASQTCHDAARVDGDGRDGWVAAGKLVGEEDIGELGLAVAREGVVGCHVGRAGFRDEASGFGGKCVASGRQINDSDVGIWLGCCGLFQDREQLLGQEMVADVIGAELDLVAFFGQSGRLRRKRAMSGQARGA